MISKEKNVTPQKCDLRPHIFITHITCWFRVLELLSESIFVYLSELLVCLLTIFVIIISSLFVGTISIDFEKIGPHLDICPIYLYHTFWVHMNQVSSDLGKCMKSYIEHCLF